MRFNPARYHRRSIRLKRYDYRQPGAYFVTICAQNRECLFGEIVQQEMRLNDAGRIVEDEWFRTSVVRPNVELDAFVVMPNHIHGIICIVNDGRGTARRAPTMERFGHPIHGSLPTIICAFKSAATKRVNERRGTPGAPVWQRNYYEHVTRNESELNRIREYITGNPARWDEDIDNPAYSRGTEASASEEEFGRIFTESRHGRM